MSKHQLLLLLLVLQAPCDWGVEIPTGGPARVGLLGGSERLSIEGVQTFTEADIRRALRTDLDYLVASHPEASPAQCLAALEDRVRAGYRSLGFPEVAVRARFDLAAGRIKAKVTEGPRFRCGALQVTGLKSIPVADFTRRLAEKPAPASDHTHPTSGLWESGEPVSYTPESLASYTVAASNTFAALGRFAATFQVKIQPQPTSGTATLAIIVTDEGPAAVLRDIEVVGNKRNRRDAVIGFLGLSKGMKVTQDLIDEKALALTQIARFADSSITLTTPDPDGRVALRIKVVENGRLPPLEQTPSREERTLMRLRAWFLAWESRQEDLIIARSQPAPTGNRPWRIEVIVAPSGGIVARVLGNAPGVDPLPDLYSIVVKTDTLALYSQAHQRKLQIPLPTGYSRVFFLKLGSSTDSPTGFDMFIGAGLSTAQTNSGWQLRLDLLPAAMIDCLYRPGTKATWQDDVLTVRTDDFVARVEEGTGRLLEFGSIDGQSTVRFSGGAFAKAMDQIAASTSTYPDAFQSRRPLGSALGFIAAEVALAKPLWAPAHSPPQPPAALAAALEKLLASSFLDPLQTLLDKENASRGDQEFTIPSRLMENQEPVRQMIGNVMVWCAGHAQELAPADSWLQTLLRESAFTLTSRTEHTPAALARLAAGEDLGPLGCYVLLHALLWSNQDTWAMFPELGLRRLTTTDLRRDYRMLLDPGSVMTRCLANLARELGTLTKSEVEAIAECFPPDGAAVVRELASATAKAKDLPASEAVGPPLDRWWETTAGGRFEADFRFHARRPAQR